MIKYKVIPFGEGILQVSKDGNPHYKQVINLSKFRANVIESHSGKAIVIPSPSQFVVKFESLSDALIFLEIDGIPIEDDLNPIYKNRRIINNLEQLNTEVFNSLSRKIGYEVRPSLNSGYLSEINNLINNKIEHLTFADRYFMFFFDVGIFIGESVLLAGKHKWVFEERFHYNPYLEPELFKFDGKRLNLWGEVRTMLKPECDCFDMDKLILRWAAK